MSGKNLHFVIGIVFTLIILTSGCVYQFDIETAPNMGVKVLPWESIYVVGNATIGEFPKTSPHVSYCWYKMEGPGKVFFEEPNSSITKVRFQKPGTYVLRLEGKVGGLTDHSDQIIRVIQPMPHILPLGDSITANEPNYRRYLWKLLMDEGYKVDFIGSVNGNSGQDFDGDHEGHGAYTTDEILQGKTNGDGLENWSLQWDAPPDIILVHLGTNDLEYNQNVSSTINDLRDVIITLRSINPNCAILLAQIIPGKINQEPLIPELNFEIRKLQKEMDTNQSPILLVDMWTDFNLRDDASRDQVHPKESGAAKMAVQWFDAIEHLYSGEYPNS